MATSTLPSSNRSINYLIHVKRPWEKPDPEFHLVTVMIYGQSRHAIREATKEINRPDIDVLLGRQIFVTSTDSLRIELHSAEVQITPPLEPKCSTVDEGLLRQFQFMLSKRCHDQRQVLLNCVLSGGCHVTNEFTFRWCEIMPQPFKQTNISATGRRAIGFVNNTFTGRSPNNDVLDTDDAESSTTEYTSGSEEQMESLTVVNPPDPWNENPQETTDFTLETLDDTVSRRLEGNENSAPSQEPGTAEVHVSSALDTENQMFAESLESLLATLRGVSKCRSTEKATATAEGASLLTEFLWAPSPLVVAQIVSILARFLTRRRGFIDVYFGCTIPNDDRFHTAISYTPPTFWLLLLVVGLFLLISHKLCWRRFRAFRHAVYISIILCMNVVVAIFLQEFGFMKIVVFTLVGIIWDIWFVSFLDAIVDIFKWIRGEFVHLELTRNITQMCYGKTFAFGWEFIFIATFGGNDPRGPLISSVVAGLVLCLDVVPFLVNFNLKHARNAIQRLREERTFVHQHRE